MRIQVPRLIAEMTPSGTPTSAAIASAAKVSWTVAGSCEAIWLVTSRPVTNEVPRSPDTEACQEAAVLDQERVVPTE